jgi:hypothetical protein
MIRDDIELRIAGLIEGYYLGTLTDAEHEELAAALMGRRDLRDRFRQAARIDGELRYLAGREARGGETKATEAGQETTEEPQASGRGNPWPEKRNDAMTSHPEHPSGATLDRLDEPGAQQPPTLDAKEPTAPRLDESEGGPPAVPGYEVEEEVGRGGTGVVYRARHLALGRTVALKMILVGGHAGEAARGRFRSEAEAIARLQHPGIVQVFEVGEHQGLPFLSLEFCSQGSLEEYLGGTPLPPGEAGQLVRALAEAVQQAHEARVIHRDLKPANVLLVPRPGASPAVDEERPPVSSWAAKITDFGLAKKLDEATRTQTGAVLGTPSYMAPEQAQGKNQEVGPQTDVYALGAILYECLTGRPPFKAATTLDTILQVVSDEPVPPGQLNPRVPHDLETICLKCLRKEPGKRYASARHLAEDLQRFEKGKPIAARPVGAGERGWRWCRRNPAVASLSVLVALVLVVGTALSASFAIKAEQARQAEARRANENKALAERNQGLADAERQAKQALAEEVKKTEQALRASERAREKAEFVTYAFRIGQARQEIRRGRPYEARSILTVCDPKLCRWEHDFVLRQTIKQQLDLLHDSFVSSVAFSPDGTRIVSGSSDKTVKVWDAATGAEALTLKGHTSGVRSVAFSPDGTRIVSGSSDKTVRLWDAATGAEALTLKGHTGPVWSVAFSPDGTRIVSGSYDKTVKVWDAGKD